MDQRGVSPVVGMVLLVGLTAIVAVGMLVVGTSVTDSTAGAAEIQQIETSMEAFAETGDRVSDGATDDATFSITGSEDGTASVDPDAGRVVIVQDREGEPPEVLYDESLGVYRYQHDGTEFAYQGGGVFRLDAEEGGVPQVVDAPAFQYRSGDTPTLTFPIQRVVASPDGTPTTEGRLRAIEHNREYPSEDHHENPLLGGELYLDIESEYCEGWERHVEDRTDGAVVESCDTVNRTAAGEFRALLSVPAGDTVEAAAIATHNVTPSGGANSEIDGDVVVEGGTSNVHDEVNVTGAVQDRDVELDPVPMERRIDRCRGEFTSPGTITINGSDSEAVGDDPPTYCFEDLTTAGKKPRITVAPEEDVEIVVRDGIDISGNNAYIDVIDDNGSHAVDFYVADHVEYTTNARPLGNPDDPSQTAIYTNETVRIQGDPTEVYGLVYAPSDPPPSGDHTVEIDGNGLVNGSVVSSTIHLQGDGSRIEWAPGMDGMPIGPAHDDNPVYYLHVSETKLEVAS